MKIGELKRIIENIPDNTSIYLRTGEDSDHDLEIGSIFYQSGNTFYQNGDEFIQSRYHELYFVIDCVDDIKVFENFVGAKYLYSASLLEVEGFHDVLKKHGIFLSNGNIERASENRIKMIEAVGEEYVLALEKELGHRIR